MRLFYSEQFHDIKRKTEVKARSAKRNCQRAKEKAKNEDLYELLIVLEHSEEASWPSRVVDGTLESLAIRSSFFIRKKRALLSKPHKTTD